MAVCFFISANNYAQLNYHSIKYNEKNGLESYNIKSIALDRFGFAWIGTQDGLYYFDGGSFTAIHDSLSANTSKDVKKVIYDSVFNWIWVAYSAGGLEAFDCSKHLLVKNVFLSVAGKNKPVENINTFIFTQKHELIIGLTSGIIIYSPKKSTGIDKIEAVDILIGENVQYLDTYNDTIVALVPSKGLYRFDQKSKAVSRTILPYKEPITGYLIKGSECYFSTEGKIFNCDLSTGKKDSIKIGFDITYINRWKGKKILLSTSKGNFLADFERKTIEKITFYSNGKADEGDYVITTTWDKLNNLWLGNSKSLQVSDLTKPFLFSYTSEAKQFAWMNHLYQITSISDSELILGDLSGCYYYNLSTDKTKLVSGKENPFFLSSDHLGSLFYSNKSGLDIIDQKKLSSSNIEKVFPEWRNFGKGTYFAKIDMADTLSVIATTKDSILLWNRNEKQCKKTRITEGDSPTEDIYSLTNLGNDEILVCQKSRVIIFNLKRASGKTYSFTHPATGEKITYFFDAIPVGDAIWVATYGFGIIILNRHFQILDIINSDEGLSNNGIYKLFTDSLGYVWASSNNGINRINIKNKSVTCYYTGDGIHNNAFEQFCGYKSGKRIYFGGLNGFTCIIPQDFNQNHHRPTAYISSVQFIRNKSSIVFSDIDANDITIPNDIIQTNLIISSNDLINPKKNTFYYKIEGVHKDFVSLGNKNIVSIFGFSPGRYNLIIKTATGSNIFSSDENILLIILPKWYQTWWFKTLLALIAVSIGYAFYRMRIAQLKKEEQIRSRLASDLHDDLGSTLNSVKVYVNLALIEKGNINYLNQVKESTQEAISGLRDLIWVLDDKKDSLDQLANRIGQFAVPLCRANNIDFVPQIDQNAYAVTLGKEERRNLYMIIKETINNSIKYANCSRIELVISVTNKNRRIRIADDGKGFESKKVVYGNGIKNIHSRAKMAGYKIDMVSTPGEGTSVLLQK